MIHRVLSAWLAASIVACPLLCRGGSVCCDDHRARCAPKCCDACNHSGKADPADHGSAPRDRHSPSPAECGGCICGGAVVEDSVALQGLALDSFEWIAPPADQPNVVAAELLRSAYSSPFSTPLSEDGANPGRAMRCRMMSYLC